MKAKKIEREGEQQINKHGTIMTIKEYINSASIIVEFDDDHKYQKKMRI